MTKSRPLLEGYLVPHSKFSNSLNRLTQLYKFADLKADAEGLSIIGDAGTGKTSVLNMFMDEHPPHRGPDGMQIPVLYARVPSHPTVKSLAGVILEALHSPDPERGTENERTSRIRVLMRETGTLMVVLDEFQHFYDQGTRKVMHNVADWLKILADSTCTTLVIAGLPTALDVIETNSQLMRRFSSPVRLTRFDWQSTADRDEFVALLGHFCDKLAERFRTPRFDTDEMAFRFWIASGGLMGYLTKILRQAERNAITKTSPSITLTDLHIAHKEAMWSDGRGADFVQPFRKDFTASLSASLVKQDRKIGVEMESLQSSGKRRSYRPRQPSLNDMLATR